MTQKDAIKLFEERKIRTVWDEDQEKACVEAANKEVDDAMQEVESQPTQTVTELMQNEYVVTPPAIQKELDAYQAKEAK